MSFPFAQTAGQGGNPMGLVMSYLPILFIIGVFYFIVMRPQSAAAKQRDTMLTGLQKGQTVILQAGFVGVIKAVHEKSQLLELELQPSGTLLYVERGSVDRVLTDTDLLPKHHAVQPDVNFKKKR